ncbi:hypothetical protein LWI28_012686 [Acer negundo]|uniref:Serine hydroxymethyltransferase-like domain-containing protein n=1 Tax=Acer negundo TaxID=4023 RepID=A0AAD5NEP5_ACENE|nr:hypothetical protein LWI28_012686 [Acer negundo]
MEEEKEVAYYDKLTRKGGGAARSIAVFSLKSLLSSLRVVWSCAIVMLEKKALDFRPNYARFRAVANKCGEFFLHDMAHISGLVSAKFLLNTKFHRGKGFPSLWPSKDCQQPLDVSNEFSFKVINGILSDG